MISNFAARDRGPVGASGANGQGLFIITVCLFFMLLIFFLVSFLWSKVFALSHRVMRAFVIRLSSKKYERGKRLTTAGYRSLVSHSSAGMIRREVVRQ